MGGGGCCHLAGLSKASGNALPAEGLNTAIGSSTRAAQEVAALGGSPVLELQARGMSWLGGPKWPSRRAAVGDGGGGGGNP